MDSTTPGQETSPSSLSHVGLQVFLKRKPDLAVPAKVNGDFFFSFLAKRKTIAYRSLLQAKDTETSTPNKAAFNQVSLASRCLAWASLATASDAGLAFKV